MSKYYIHKQNERLKVKFIGYDIGSTIYFQAIAKSTKGSGWYVGELMSSCDMRDFEPYTPTPEELIEWGETATLTNDNPNKVEVDDKDVNLRLECLKLAVELKPIDPVLVAQDFYKWITQKS